MMGFFLHIHGRNIYSLSGDPGHYVLGRGETRADDAIVPEKGLAQCNAESWDCRKVPILESSCH